MGNARVSINLQQNAADLQVVLAANRLYGEKGPKEIIATHQLSSGQT